MDEKELYNRLCDIEARLRRLEMLIYIAIENGSNTTTINNNSTVSTYINGTNTYLNNLYASNALYSNGQLGGSAIYLKVDSSASSKTFESDKTFFFVYTANSTTIADTLPPLSQVVQRPFSSDPSSNRFVRLFYLAAVGPNSFQIYVNPADANAKIYAFNGGGNGYNNVPIAAWNWLELITDGYNWYLKY